MVVLTLVKIDVKLFETYSILRGLGVQPISHLRVEQDFKKSLASKMFKISPTMILRMFEGIFKLCFEIRKNVYHVILIRKTFCLQYGIIGNIFHHF